MEPPLNEHDAPSSLFFDTRFIIAQCNDVENVKTMLIQNGAKHINYLSDDVTLVISDTNCPEAEEAADIFDKQVVTSLWVHLCIKAKKLLPTTAFSPLKSIFHNVIAAFSSDLSKHDIDILAATLTYYGAKVSKDIASCTHFIVASAEPTDSPGDKTSPDNTNHQIKVVAPDWVLESARLKRRCDEHLFEPKYLLPPPPPTPIPPPILPDPIVTDDKKLSTTIKPIESREQQHKIEDSSPPQDKLQSQPSQYPNQQNHTMPTSQLPRPRLPANIVRGAQPKFRPILPPNNQTMVQRPMMQQPRVIGPDQQQPKKVTINYNQYRKISPYQNNIDPQQQNQMQHQIPQYAQQQQLLSVPQPQGNMIQQPNRLPQPNMYHQARAPYQNSHMPPRGPPQQPSENPHQPQHPHQSSQIVTRFQDPSATMAQRPYQVCLQPQAVNPNYPPNNMQRQPIYYPQGGHPMQMRMPQHGPPVRHVQNEQIVYDNFNQPHHNQDTITPNQHHYISHQGQPNIPHNHPQPMPSQTNQPQISMIQPRQQFQPNLPTSVANVQVRTARNLFNNQPESPSINPIRNQPPQPPMPQTKAPRMPSNNQTQLHPSIFTQESNIAQIKAKVPVVKENFNYHGHDPKENVPKDHPFTGCVFKLVEYDEVEPKRKSRWCDAIRMAGGSFEDDLNSNVTHLICETRHSKDFLRASSMGIRCITIYWINDILAKGTLTYPWKALHLPLPYSRTEQPLSGHTISISNFHDKERSELGEMIKKTGARFTNSFSTSNSLLICRTVTGEKYERAIEWKLPISNCHILSDILVIGKRDLSSMLNQTKYQLFEDEEPFRLKSYQEVRELMKPWKKPLSLAKLKEADKSSLANGEVKNSSVALNEDSGLATGGSNNSDIELVITKEPAISDSINGQFSLDDNVKDVASKDKMDVVDEISIQSGVGDSSEQTDIKTLKAESSVEMVVDNGPIKSEVESGAKFKDFNGSLEGDNQLQVSNIEDSKIESSEKTTNLSQVCRSARKSKDPIRILMTHLDSTLVKQLESEALKLGMGFASQPTDCTHLITDRISRTSKFICAFSHATYILSYKWIVESHESNQLLDEKYFILQDEVGEEKYSFNLVYSLLKRRKRSEPLFSSYVFFVTPRVVNNVTKVKEMIEMNGGIVATRKLPTKKQVDQLKAEGKRFVVVTCPRDSHLFPSIESYASDIVDIEFIVSGILRQDIDFEPHRIKISNESFTKPEAKNLTKMSRQSSQKKQKLDDSS